MGLFSSTGQPHKRCALRWTAAGGRGREWSGREWSGGEGRGGQGRVPDCLGGLSQVGISSRSTRPWNGQPPSMYNSHPSPRLASPDTFFGMHNLSQLPRKQTHIGNNLLKIVVLLYNFIIIYLYNIGAQNSWFFLEVT